MLQFNFYTQLERETFLNPNRRRRRLSPRPVALLIHSFQNDQSSAAAPHPRIKQNASRKANYAEA